MGDETCHTSATSMAAWKKLIEIQKKIKLDDYYFPGPKKTDEELLREKYPTAQDAWEQYQAVLTLCRTEENA